MLLAGASLLILYRYYELDGLKNKEWLMKQLGNREWLKEQFGINNGIGIKHINSPAIESLDNPKVMYKKKRSNDNVDTSVKGLSVDAAWQVWRSWPHSKQLYEEKHFRSNQMTEIMQYMASIPIVNFDVGHRGTQLKAMVTLKGDQLAVFKPRRYVHKLDSWSSQQYAVTDIIETMSYLVNRMLDLTCTRQKLWDFIWTGENCVCIV